MEHDDGTYTSHGVYARIVFMCAVFCRAADLTMLNAQFLFSNNPHTPAKPHVVHTRGLSARAPAHCTRVRALQVIALH